jgi:hypothetical protein
MQLVEVSVTGVRSAVITLEADGTPLRIVLFPMVHLGTPGYYRAVTDRLAGCGLIVAEGISQPPASVRALTLAYQLPGRQYRNLGLTSQDIDYAALRGIPVARPDMSGREFRRHWSGVPVLERLAAWLLVPPIALAMALRGTRRTFGRHLSLDDLPSFQDEQVRQLAPGLTRAILDERDLLLTDCLAGICRAHAGERMDVAVVWGAEHMRAVTRELHRRHGYRPRSAEWLTVFDF